MHHYEITFLTRSEENDGGVRDLIAQLDGRILEQSAPQRRKLAYPIKKELGAVYFTYQVELDSTKISDLNKRLERNDDILRHLIIADGIRKQAEGTTSKLKDKDLEVPESLTQGMAELAAEAAALTTVPPEVTEETLSETAEEAPVVAEEPAAEPKKELSAEESTAEDRQKQLDEKLKQILGK